MSPHTSKLSFLLFVVFCRNNVCSWIFNKQQTNYATTVSHPDFVTSKNTRKIKTLQQSLDDNHFEEQLSSGDTSKKEKITRVFFDIAVGNDSLGRMTFRFIEDASICPNVRENFMKLCTGERRPVDPRCTYVGCSFKHSPQFVEGFPQYRWAHEMEGKKRNALGRPTERISDSDTLRSCSRSIYGGVYYGMKYEDICGAFGVVLTVPLVGPSRGLTSFSIVRVDESPREWKERLLLNSAVLGSLESGIDVLHAMARQTRAPPVVVDCGKI